MLLLDFSASILLSGINLRQVNWREVRTLIPLSVIGILLGTFIDQPADAAHAHHPVSICGYFRHAFAT